MLTSFKNVKMNILRMGELRIFAWKDIDDQ